MKFLENSRIIIYIFSVIVGLYYWITASSS
jgi:hypothetical protein